MEKVCEFLQKAKIFYVATVKGDQPRVRPFGVAHIIAGKLREDEKETFPTELAKSIAKKGIVVAPTLVMMETFSKSGQSGYQKSDYSNAEAAVKLLHDCGVPILAATDANPGSFAPGVGYGDTLHHEMGLLTKAGLTPIEVLTAASSQNADAFG